MTTRQDKSEDCCAGSATDIWWVDAEGNMHRYSSGQRSTCLTKKIGELYSVDIISRANDEPRSF